MGHLGSLEAFASCSSRAQSSLVIGRRETQGGGVRLSTVATRRGVWDMDHHRGLNLIGEEPSPRRGRASTAPPPPYLLRLCLQPRRVWTTRFCCGTPA